MPDPRNVLKTPAGFVIVDWDFVQLAPPERDLWSLAQADRTVLAAYTEATGTAAAGCPDREHTRTLSDVASASPFPASQALAGRHSPR